MSPTPAGSGIRLATIDPAAFRHTPWKNGGGVTIDVAESMLPGFAPGSWEGMVWRFGRTAIVTPGPFSDLERLSTASRCWFPVRDSCSKHLMARSTSGSRSSRSGLPEKPGSSAGSKPDRSKSSISLATGHACRSISHASRPAQRIPAPAGVHIIYAADNCAAISPSTATPARSRPATPCASMPAKASRSQAGLAPRSLRPFFPSRRRAG